MEHENSESSNICLHFLSKCPQSILFPYGSKSRFTQKRNCRYPAHKYSFVYFSLDVSKQETGIKNILNVTVANIPRRNFLFTSYWYKLDFLLQLQSSWFLTPCVCKKQPQITAIQRFLLLAGKINKWLCGWQCLALFLSGNSYQNKREPTARWQCCCCFSIGRSVWGGGGTIFPSFSS
jgi:hypothetical protein